MSKVSEAMRKAGLDATIDGEEIDFAAIYLAMKTLDPDFSPPVEQGDVERALSALIDHADSMEAQNSDYNTDEGPLRSRPLVDAIAALAALRNSPPTNGEVSEPPLSSEYGLDAGVGHAPDSGSREGSETLLDRR